tara:strand:+ start:227 stop:424 length:198 start_codon:yes stop_codon:yes gene_type:complete
MGGAFKKTKGVNKMKEVIIADYTNQEIDFLSEMIHEKLIDMGYNNEGTFSFDLTVSFEEDEKNED